MNKIKSIVVVTAWIITTYLCFYPLYYWWFNPDLTQMQVLKEFWHYYLAFLFGMCLSFVIIEDKNKNKD